MCQHLLPLAYPLLPPTVCVVEAEFSAGACSDSLIKIKKDEIESEAYSKSVIFLALKI